MDDSADASGWHSLTARADGAEIAAQSLGRATDPAVLLIGGATWSRDWWDDGFCRALVAAGLFVIRFDPRDTGQSTVWPPGAPGYTARDLVDDVVAVLDAFGVARATIAGLSMGGGLAQGVAARYPARVRALALLSTSPAGDVGVVLPPPAPSLAATFDAPSPDWSSREAVVEWVVRMERPYAGPGLYDENAMRRLAGAVWDRAPSMASALNHFIVAGAAASVDMGAVRGVPALVAHGSADPLFPLAHGRALADALRVPLVVLDGVGHQAPPARVWPVIVPAIAAVAGAAGSGGGGSGGPGG